MIILLGFVGDRKIYCAVCWLLAFIDLCILSRSQLFLWVTAAKSVLNTSTLVT